MEAFDRPLPLAPTEHELPAPPPGPLEPPRTRRVLSVAFHLGGLLLSAAAAVVGFYALVLVSFGTSTCRNDPSEAEGLADLRLGIALVALGVAAAPGGWALLARWTRHAAWPWATLAGVVAGLGVLVAATTTEVATWCF